MTATLKSAQVRTLKALAAAKGPLSRKKISEVAFKGNSVNFAPILNPMLEAKLVKSVELDIDGSKEEAFTVTASGRKAAAKAPEASANGRGAAQHQPLPKPGGVITKTYKGKEVKVKVLADGFEFKGRKYSSLTAAAKAVRGTDQEVNGWLFFGLTK